MIDLSDDERAQILRSLSGVGISKSVGYLPLNTVTSILGIDVEVLTREYQDKGLSVRIFSPDTCCIKSGALYVYESSDLRIILDEDRRLLTANGWDNDPDQFVNQVARFWVEKTNPVYPVIQRAFGDDS